ncbi:MAG: LysR family transcriptional regulator [Candidatus Schekmanbacteria bacterium]|nr:MAG: LysR family transcriptional regulator [Candidatus Schekmanbacteria bacterium]
MKLSVKSKVWLEIEGKPFFGEGRKRLLQEIEKTGSISSAASKLGITYRRAWSYIKSMEERSGLKLVEKTKGGAGYGGTTLTKDGRKLIDYYEAISKGIRDEVDKKFKKFKFSYR